MKKYVANIVHDNLATEDIKLGLSIFNKHLHRAGVGLRVVHVTEDHVVYEPFIISWDAPISLKTIDGEVTTLKLSMPIYGLPFEQKKAILGEAQVMLRTGEVFVIGGDYCSFSGVSSVEFTPNVGEQYHRVMKNGTFMPHSYPTPKQWALKISRTIEEATVEYLMSHEDPYPTREKALLSGEYEFTTGMLHEDIRTPNTCFVTPKGHAACAFDLFGEETGTLFSEAPLTGAEQEQLYEGIVKYIKTSVAEAHDRAFEEWEANLRYGV